MSTKSVLKRARGKLELDRDSRLVALRAEILSSPWANLSSRNKVKKRNLSKERQEQTQ